MNVFSYKAMISDAVKGRMKDWQERGLLNHLNYEAYKTCELYIFTSLPQKEGWWREIEQKIFKIMKW